MSEQQAPPGRVDQDRRRSVGAAVLIGAGVMAAIDEIALTSSWAGTTSTTARRRR
ncbi:hypothetical protein [Georgenia sp. SYP-B2076]|uniref:hypothetical protein n=1 Tax=Georgenia sp. SYP-B2076 TaxID=2495881 RepID=UPI001F0C1772|nr:hypothetical protein [Georgenia sp. SYP-B2076]